jgi:hypothetical protein
MKIIGTTYEQFFKATKAALAPLIGNDEIRDSKLRSFLNRQLFPKQNTAENEHRIPELFQQSEKVVESQPSHACVVILEKYENDDSGNSLVDVDSYICIGTSATNKKLIWLFENFYSEHANGLKILDAHIVESKIESLCEDMRIYDEELDAAITKMTDQISEFSDTESCEWLVENFDIDELITDEFFGDFLNADMYRIRYEHSEISY